MGRLVLVLSDMAQSCVCARVPFLHMFAVAHPVHPVYFILAVVLFWSIAVVLLLKLYGSA